MSVSHEYVVMYDYGMGGLWAIATANSIDHVRQKLPELQVSAEIPNWMSPAEFQDLRMKTLFHLEDESTYPDWLCMLLKERSR